ncbi:MAG: transglycosylase SLT domain-containing protein [Rhodospirillaceae bacterium]|nr:transglycosylase SLT domain-containing protein [Rhodospirillaceae bacterium]
MKAQYWQESRLNPTARSPAGAEGIAQFMPGTWRDAVKALGWPRMLSRRDAVHAIEGGAWYMRKLREGWRNRAPADRHDLALASYNAGMGNILKAQKHCGDARLWSHIAPCLPRVTGPRNARETTTYVSNIHRWHRAMEAEK